MLLNFFLWASAELFYTKFTGLRISTPKSTLNAKFLLEVRERFSYLVVPLFVETLKMPME